MKKIGIILSIWSIVFFNLCLPERVSAQENAPQIIGESAIVVDVETGEVLYEKASDTRHYPASITKCMTSLIVLGHRNLDDTVEYSREALLSIESGSSAAYIKSGEIMTVEDSLYVMMLHSANDIAHGLAYDISGNLPGFAQLMNEKAEELGCTDTNFVNASGLQDENHYTTAKDMSKIAQAAYNNKTLRKIMETVEFNQPATNLTKNTRRWVNGNRMIREESEYYYEPCLGGKTGYTITAGGTLVTYAKIQNRVLACVILKSKNSATAYEDSIKLYDYIDQNQVLSAGRSDTGKEPKQEIMSEETQEDTGLLKNLGQSLRDHWIAALVTVLALWYIKKRIELECRRRARRKKRKQQRRKRRR